MINYEKFLSTIAKSMKASEIRELLAAISVRKDVISLAGGAPDPKTFPKSKLAEVSVKVITEYGDSSLQYSETKGVRSIREILAGFLEKIRGFKTNAENILITTGSQQALDLIARSLVDPGEVIITENPTYLAALGSFRMSGADIIGIRIDEYGMRTEILEDTVKKLISEGRVIKFIYVIPVAQNPAGTTMSIERKKHLLEIASRYDVLVVEDDPYSYFTYDSSVDTTSLKTLDREDRVIYISTISKILAPGLRIGWIISPDNLTRRFEIVKQYLDLHTPTLNQYILGEILKSDIITEHISKLAPYYKVKRDAIIKAIEDHFPEDIWYTKPVGGLFVFVYVNIPGFNATKLMPVALDKYKVAYVPGQSFHTDGSGANSMRLNFSFPPPEKIEEGIRRLGDMIRNETPVS